MRRSALDGWINAMLPPGEDLAAWQLRKLQGALAHAKNCPFWRRKLAGLAPGDIRALVDIEKVPLTTAAELAAHGPEMVCVSQREISRIVTLQTSGTTGPAKRVFFTKGDQELTRDFFHHGMLELAGPGDKVLILLPGETPGSIGHLLAEALLRIPAAPLPFGVVGEENADEAGRLILEEDVNVLVGIPHQLLLLAEGAHAAAIKEKGALKTVLYATDYVPPPMAARIEGALGCKGFEHYGMTEMGLGGGVTCAAGRGYHLREADLLFEIVDPATGNALPPGAEGELVFTTLTRRGMPLIRYRTGDAAAFEVEKCPCGSNLRLLRKVPGRAGRALPLPGGGGITLAALDDSLFAAADLLDYEPGMRGKTLTIRYKGAASEAEMHALLRNSALGALLENGVLEAKFLPGFARGADKKAIKKRTIKDD